MAIELGGITVRNLTHIAVHERARIVRHGVPGMSGDFAQSLGHSSVEVSFRGVFYGGNTVDDLSRLRGAFLEKTPVDFFTAAVGEGYFAQVLISKLEVSQRAGYPEQFEFSCEVVEYVEPPEPVTADPFAELDAGLLDEATGFVDDAQNALEQVSELGDLLGLVPDLGNPTQALTRILDDFNDVAGGAGETLKTISDLF
jgi:hypothetical protein